MFWEATSDLTISLFLTDVLLEEKWDRTEDDEHPLFRLGLVVLVFFGS